MNSRRRQITSLMLGLPLTAAAAAAFPPDDPNLERQEIEAIRKAIGSQVEAWNRGDLESFMTVYWRSEKLSFFSGSSKTEGWETTLNRYRSRYQGEGREMGRLAFTDLQIEMLGSTSAFARGHWGLELSKGDVGGLFTLILKKLPEGWRIVHDHTSA